MIEFEAFDVKIPYLLSSIVEDVELQSAAIY